MQSPPSTFDERQAAAGDGQPPDGVIWLGALGAVLGLLAVGGVWVYALVRPWFEPWDEPWGALIMMVAPYPVALLVSLAGRINRPRAGIALAGCAVLSAFIVWLGRVGLFFLPATLVLLVAAVLVLSQRWQLRRSAVLAGVILTVGAVGAMLSAAATLFEKPEGQQCIAYWELRGGGTLWRDWHGEPIVLQQTPEGFRDDVRRAGLLCNLNPLTRHEAVFGITQIIAGSLMFLAVPVSAVGLIFLAPVVMGLTLAVSAVIVQPLVLVAVLCLMVATTLLLFERRRRPVADEAAASSRMQILEEVDPSRWQRPV